ncbi:AMP-binding protein [Govanella unica]|uniref:AMP-binding protein n=1 Tax=Govanella unica TaxID=2975056 RepID=A0A9X3Z6Y8_9PROT|nr:AMP-binding protein [Govania unica]MDA5193518.1 AMP-binding protein [Govania unica]
MTSSPPWFDPKTPAREDCVVSCLIDKWAAATPDKTFILYENGDSWSWSQTRSIARATAAAFAARGIRAGDTVLAWLPNNATMIRSWFGANYLGATLVPINTSYRGRLLEHAIRTSDARLMIVHPALIDRLSEIEHSDLEHLIVDSPDLPNLDCGLTMEPVSVLDGDSAAEFDFAPQIWDTPLIIFTSGTTGPSKGVITSYLHQWTTATVQYGYMTAADRILINLPMFHVGGTSSIYAALARGASAALFDGFNTREFWPQLRATGSTTISGLIGAMASFLTKTPPQPDDGDNPLTYCTLAPITDDTIALSKRFNFHYVSGFNMTELSSPLITPLDERTHRSCGRPRSGVECRVVDDHDMEVGANMIGELVVRSDSPWVFFKGYHKNPEATAEAWRNGWFHTGDLVTRDADGNFFFIDRKKDAIRRRGENISSIEVELDVYAHAAVLEVAAYGVPCPAGEEEVMVAVAAKPGHTLDPQSLVEFLIPRMAHFMVPRYVRVVEALPKTPTNKIQKVQLRGEGVTSDTWDREASGLALKRQKLK